MHNYPITCSFVIHLYVKMTSAFLSIFWVFLYHPVLDRCYVVQIQLCPFPENTSPTIVQRGLFFLGRLTLNS